MNENEKNVTIAQETQAETPPEKELTPEEKLAERERVLAEREKAIEIKELKSQAMDILKAEDIPTDLADFLNYESKETMTAGLEKLTEIMYKRYGKSTGMTVSTIGFAHTRSCSNEDDSFLKGLKKGVVDL